MTAEFIKSCIENECQAFDLVVLKGFSPALIRQLGNYFSLLDDYVIENDRIVLENINETQLMMSITNYKLPQKAICTCESLIKMCTMISGLEILQKRICVLHNNLFALYPNPTNADIPDFDSDDFCDTDSESALYSLYYSYCICENGEQRVQYIDNYSQSNPCVHNLKWIDPLPYALAGSVEETNKLPLLSTKNGTLRKVTEELYQHMTLQRHAYAIEAEETEEEAICAFVHAARKMGEEIKIYKASRHTNPSLRPELHVLLKQVWGYESFRNLNIYQNLNVNHDVTEISQGAIIETVIRQAEHAYRNEEEEVNNILLTSPTGAGKSLLFQLSAIYLAEKYGLVTIVISPLVALMNDQVDGLTGYQKVAALNSNKTASEKAAILEGIQEGNIHILYLAPELLLSYTITTFLGNRKLGLLVVDEAHTVTTWGRDFRVDYWFLGDYLRKAKRVLDYSFPIFALTATAVWDPSGKNDMIFDTIRSLNMDPCIKYIGVVRRENITFEIEQSDISTKYELNRKLKTIARIREALSAQRKTIVYFPFRRTVDSIVYSEEIEDIKDKIARYHASLLPDEKIMNAESFRNGSKPIMCATKAFGMGIDVSDIQEVYHHAPTGCLSDYVQEIGRLARNPKIQGIAKIDFSPNDFRYIRKLHGLSAIKPYQLIMVLKKLMALFKINGEKRNMLISSSDFEYIFPLSTPENIDQNLKSCLLLISNDLLNKLRFHAIIVRPKSLFSKCFISVQEDESKVFHRLYHPYLTKVEQNTFILNSDKIWTEKYNNMSFPMFKAKLAEGKIFKDFHIELKSKITICLHQSVEDTYKQVEEFFHHAHNFLNKMSNTHHRIEFSTMKAELPHDYDNVKREHFLETFRLLYASPKGLGGEIAAYCSIFTSQEGQMNSKEAFQVMQSGYENVANLYITSYKQFINGKDISAYCDSKDKIVKLSEFLSSLGIADYQKVGGDQPVIFIRINNPYYLNMLIRSKKYENSILNSIYEKYQFSERVFTYFFTTPMTDTQRWDFIEAYFLGASEEELLHFI